MKHVDNREYKEIVDGYHFFKIKISISAHMIVMINFISLKGEGNITHPSQKIPELKQ